MRRVRTYTGGRHHKPGRSPPLPGERNRSVADLLRVINGTEEQRVIGESTPASAIVGPSEEDPPPPARAQLLLIEGEDIANVFFDHLAVDIEAMREEEFSRLVKEEARKLGLELPT